MLTTVLTLIFTMWSSANQFPALDITRLLILKCPEDSLHLFLVLIMEHSQVFTLTGNDTLAMLFMRCVTNAFNNNTGRQGILHKKHDIQLLIEKFSESNNVNLVIAFVTLQLKYA